MENSQYTILLVGAGNMGAALLQSWLSAEIDPSRIAVADPSPSPVVQALISQHGLYAGTRAADVIVLAVKPQMMGNVLPSLKHLITHETLVISIAAGISISTYEAELGVIPVVRTMPNLPAAYGAGLTGAFANAQANSGEAHIVRTTELLSASGLVMWLNDEQAIDALTAISGSGPGYVFAMVEALQNSALMMGFGPDEAELLAKQTFIGAACMLVSETKTSAVEFRNRVTSPNGTTEAGISKLLDGGKLQTLMNQTVQAAFERARELSK